MNNGGWASPHNGASEYETCNGMSLRDWFAGMALQSYTASYHNSKTDVMSFDSEFEAAAETAYRLADEMLKARDA